MRAHDAGRFGGRARVTLAHRGRGSLAGPADLRLGAITAAIH
ncbi:hypothetical protein [Streptomyces sp. NPDC048637]